MTNSQKPVPSALRKSRLRSALTCLYLVGAVLPKPLSAAPATPPKLPPVRPERAGVDSHWLCRIDTIVAAGKVPMTVDTMFDLASITEPVATATSAMLLVERGAIRLRDRVADRVPEFGQNGKEKTTIAQLLTHQGGLIPDNPLADDADGPETAWQRIFALKPVVAPGTKFVYTDFGKL